MDRLAAEMDLTMSRMQRADEANGTYGGCGPRLNDEIDASEWLGKGGAKLKLSNEKPQGITINYDVLVERWNQ
jgi:glycerol transport system substrate-binding protein